MALGLLDLNAVTLKTSATISFRRYHVNGEQYTLYLQTAADRVELSIQTEVDLQKVEPLPQGGFTLRASSGELSTQVVI